ncbi:MAG: sulfotransferase [Gammaproteobacteria bacterium]|nr:sulfotransferase [Gammaproteobacteria bacterium]NND54678.1 sulfotransferase [Gammaproteobacteria bacterium]
MTDKYLGEDLIFIISLPRSGSTLLQRVLSGHPEVGVSSEPWILLHQAYARRSVGILAEYDQDWSALGINEFIKHYTDGDDAYDDGVRAFAQAIYGNAKRQAGVSRFIDKTPRYVLILDDLQRWFPRAKFVFLLRNPLSVLSSVVNTQIQHDLSTLERFANELLRGPAAMLDAIAAIEATGDDAIVVRYEDFVSHPENELERICRQISLDFDPTMLDYSKNPEIKGVMKDRTGVQQHDRPVGERQHGWRKMLGDAQQLEFARGYLTALGPDLVTRFGYDFDELNDAVRGASERHRPSGYIFPWKVAIVSPDAKKGRDQLDVMKYRNIRDHGPVMGRIRTYYRYVVGFWKALRFTFGRVESVPDKMRKQEAARKEGDRPVFR